MIFIIVFTDEDLEKVRSRDPVIFEKIFKEYRYKIYNFLIIKTNGDEMLSDELFSDIFHSALVSAPKIKDLSKIFGWLMQIARRRHIDHLRKTYRKKNYESHEELNENELKNKEGDEEDKKKAILINIALENIKPEYSKLLKLMYIENKSRKEIAGIIGKSISSVESLLFRARESLKKELNKLV